MKSIRGFALGLALGIAAAIATVGLAQTTKPADQGQKAESCAMTSCCCHGDSAKHSGQEHAKGQMKHSGRGRLLLLWRRLMRNADEDEREGNAEARIVFHSSANFLPASFTWAPARIGQY